MNEERDADESLHRRLVRDLYNFDRHFAARLRGIHSSVAAVWARVALARQRRPVARRRPGQFRDKRIAFCFCPVIAQIESRRAARDIARAFIPRAEKRGPARSS